MNVLKIIDGEDWYQSLVGDIQRLEYTGIVVTKHAIGKRVIADFDKFEYGDHTVEQLARDIGVQKREVYCCIQFAKKYPELEKCDDITQLSWYQITHDLLPAPRKERDVTPLPDGKWSVIYADPPWKYDSGEQHSTEDQATVITDSVPDDIVHTEASAVHYKPKTIKELCEMDIKSMAADNAVMFFWVTSPLLAECFEVITAWGFTYKTSFVWDKIAHNVGHYNSVRHELLLICTRGSFKPTMEPVKLVDSVQSIERTEHSKKPGEFRQIIEMLYPDEKYIELFAREHADGWDVWGDEV